MNGQNSNTNGASVANAGFWPKAILPAIISGLGQALNSLKGLQSGALIPAAVDFSAKSGSDKISDEVMDEICRRQVITVEKQDPGNVLFQPTPPDDHTKAWWKTDPVTNLPIQGELRQWIEATGTWERVENAGIYVAPAKRTGLMKSPAGVSTINFAFQDIGTDDYRVILSPTFRGDTAGSWNAPPGSFPSGFGYGISNKTSNILSVTFFGIPTGGIVWEVDLEDRQTTAA